MWSTSICGLLLQAVLTLASTTTTGDTLIACLQNGSPSDAVLVPSSAGYNTSRLAKINARISYFPAAIVFPNTPQDVQKYAKCGAANGVAVVGRSGGHSYASYGAGGKDGSLVIDLSKMKSVTVDASGSAKIQTGNRLGEIAQKLWDNGQRALPHGVCPYVGSGGHTAFGGFGPFSRYAGLLHDHVTSAQIVLANGTLTTASAVKNPDLFWALRGAGASYGIVTEWTFSTLAAPPTVISYRVDYITTVLTAEQAKELLKNWQEIALSAPDNLSVICSIGKAIPIGGPKLYLDFRGTYYGTEADFNALSSNWSGIYSPGNFTHKANNWYDGLVALSGPLSTSEPETSISFFAKSIFTKSAVATTQWNRLFEFIDKEGFDVDVDWFIELDRYGGAVSKQAPDYTAFAHRDAVISLQFFAGITPDPLPADGVPYLNKLAAVVDPNPKAAYANYVDPTLTPAQWKLQYFAGHYPRLVSIKRAVDPENVFRFPQSITLS
ncbi:Reticuline oxidase-like protein [Rhizoctonia solani]|uniref:Reticuline oxidase-like protein n=1 Tax=Rhizoctonia solani TaxID=456999 RepID=A0A0K6FPI8_9AGAM|nr:Reticuline oxidase-like protein [Rhizoctonia solani]